MRPAERVRSWLHFTAAEVPCKTAPFASFSGRTEKGGPARPERGPIFSSLIKAIKKASITQNFYEMVLCILLKRYPYAERPERNAPGGFLIIRAVFSYAGPSLIVILCPAIALPNRGEQRRPVSLKKK